MSYFLLDFPEGGGHEANGHNITIFMCKKFDNIPAKKETLIDVSSLQIGNIDKCFVKQGNRIIGGR